MTVKNPCQSVCNIDFKNQMCQTCFRLSNEKHSWIQMTDDIKKKTIVLCNLRRHAALKGVTVKIDDAALQDKIDDIYSEYGTCMV